MRPKWFSEGYFRRFVVLLVLGSALVGLSTASNQLTRPLNGFDELAHLDYAVKMSQGQLPLWGLQYSPESIALANCVGTYDRPVAVCGATPSSVSDFFPEGLSYQAQQSPLGYLLAAVVLGMMPDDFPQGTKLAVLRISNLIWMLMLVGLLSAFVAMITTHIVAGMGSIAFVVLNPQVYAASTYVTNDAVIALAATTMTIFFYFAWNYRNALSTSRHLCYWILGASLIGILAGLVKATLVLLPIAVIVFFSMKKQRLITDSTRKLVAVPSVVGASLIASSYLYQKYVRSLSPSDVHDVMSQVLSQTYVSDLQGWTMAKSVAGIVGGFLPMDPNSAFQAAQTSSVFLMWSLLSFSVFILSLSRNEVRLSGIGLNVRDLGIAVLISALIAAVAWPLISFWLYSSDFALPVRYLVPLIPLAGLVVLPFFEDNMRLARAYGLAAVGAAVLVASPQVLMNNIVSV